MSDLEPEDTLLSVTAELGVQYKAWKAGEKKKDEQRNKFFALINQHFESETMAEQIVTVRASSEDEARELVAKSHPKWIVDDLRVDPGGHSDHEDDHLWEVIIKENPEYKAYSFVNPDDGQVYTRQVQSGSIMLDDERLQEKDPDLWLEVTRIPNREFMENLIYHCGIDGQDVEEELDSLWAALDGPRALIPFEELPAETVARLGEYIYEGEPKIKLAAPRKAKEEDLGTTDSR